ncbi:DUF5011 domain-containing protein, partial [Patescibacteria group bacterium]|nr:DUF5011 domain-containing protein [Patescibacteria group bacterium]
GDITANITTNNPTDTTTAGTYTITYNVTDTAENPAIEVTRTVIVKEAESEETTIEINNSTTTSDTN